MKKNSNASPSACDDVHKSNIVAQELLFDLKVLLKEYYVGKFTEDGQSLKLSFYNGHNFKLQIEELN